MTLPSGPMPTIPKLPEPVTRHTIFNSEWTTACGLPVGDSNAYNDPAVDEPRISGSPVVWLGGQGCETEGHRQE